MKPVREWSAKRTASGSLSPTALFRFYRWRHLECAVCNQDIVRLSECKYDRVETGSAPVRLPRCDKAVHTSGGGRAALTCRYRLSWHTPEPRATQLFRQFLSPRRAHFVHTTK